MHVRVCACTSMDVTLQKHLLIHEQPLNGHFTLVPQRQEDSKS